MPAEVCPLLTTLPSITASLWLNRAMKLPGLLLVLSDTTRPFERVAAFVRMSVKVFPANEFCVMVTSFESPVKKTPLPFPGPVSLLSMISLPLTSVGAVPELLTTLIAACCSR